MAARASAKLFARLAPGETLGDRVLRVDHAGEHGAVCVYRAQRRLARWSAPALIAEIDARSSTDPGAVAILREIIAEEQEHHDRSARHLAGGPLQRALDIAVGMATEAVIWIGMRR